MRISKYAKNKGTQKPQVNIVKRGIYILICNHKRFRIICTYIIY